MSNLHVVRRLLSRDAHDTFFLTKPVYSSCDKWPQDYLERVRKVHEEGGYGSLGYGYNWKLQEAEKNKLFVDQNFALLSWGHT